MSEVPTGDLAEEIRGLSPEIRPLGYVFFRADIMARIQEQMDFLTADVETFLKGGTEFVSTPESRRDAAREALCLYRALYQFCSAYSRREDLAQLWIDFRIDADEIGAYGALNAVELTDHEGILEIIEAAHEVVRASASL